MEQTMKATHTGVKISDMTAEGAGVGTFADEKKVFVTGGVWVGDTVSVCVTKEKKRFAIATLVEVESPSKLRSKPLCSLHGFAADSCGGCDWMHASYESQLAMKESIVRFALRANKLETDLQPIHPSPKAYGYRNRARLHWDGDKLGFFAAASKELVDIDTCPVLSAAATAQLKDARAFLRSKQEKKLAEIAEVFLDDSKPLANQDFLTPAGFRQANSLQNQFVKKKIMSFIHKHQKSDIIELFAGSGNLTGALCESGVNPEQLTCVDVKASEADFQTNMPGLQYIALDLFKNWNTLFKSKKINTWNTLLLDPPRSGWSVIAEFCEKATMLQNIVYVSCNPNSFAKDCKALVAKGWRLDTVTPVDMMPQTSQVELIAFLSRQL